LLLSPVQTSSGELLENLKLDNVVVKFTPTNVALAGKHSKINVERPSRKVFVDTITLGDIAKVVDVGGAVLKMDCEGYEYNVILNDYVHVRLFDEVYFGYHVYATEVPVDVLLKKLDCQGRIPCNEDFI